jgi:kynurenine formamidase
VTRTAPFGFSRVVFLSHVIDADTPVFPGDPSVKIAPAAAIQQDGYYLQAVTFGEQAGTHWAAPAHFHLGQPAADELDPGDFFRPAVVLDVRAQASRDVDFALGVAEIRQWEATFGSIPPDSAVIMWTGFEDRWDDPAAYLNPDPAGLLHYPGFSAEAARWLIDERSIGVLGIDTMGIDPGLDTSFAANRVLLEQEHRLHLENLCGLDQMPPAGGWIIIGGLRIRAGSGSPATVFGLIP